MIGVVWSKSLSFVVGLVHGGCCPECGSSWRLLSARSEILDGGGVGMVARAACSGCGCEMIAVKGYDSSSYYVDYANIDTGFLAGEVGTCDTPLFGRGHLHN